MSENCDACGGQEVLVLGTIGCERDMDIGAEFLEGAINSQITCIRSLQMLMQLI